MPHAHPVYRQRNSPAFTRRRQIGSTVQGQQRNTERTVSETQQARRYDHSFKAIHDHEVEWQDAEDNDILTLPKGLKIKILNHDPAMSRIDMKVRFPAGYVEPAHSHKSWHSIVVLKGRMCVAGKDLRAGDYVFGWDELHGPYEYPDGCEVFVVFMGESAAHEWNPEIHARHVKVWEPETEDGKKAAVAE